MKIIITKICAKLKRDCLAFSNGERKDIAAAEAFFFASYMEAAQEFLSAFYEEEDRNLLEDKAGRKAAGPFAVARRAAPWYNGGLTLPTSKSRGILGSSSTAPKVASYTLSPSV